MHQAAFYSLGLFAYSKPFYYILGIIDRTFLYLQQRVSGDREDIDIALLDFVCFKPEAQNISEIYEMME